MTRREIMATLKKKPPKGAPTKEHAVDAITNRGRERKLTREEIRERAIKAANKAVDKYVHELP
jgi:hypothetical protein